MDADHSVSYASVTVRSQGKVQVRLFSIFAYSRVFPLCGKKLIVAFGTGTGAVLSCIGTHLEEVTFAAAQDGLLTYLETFYHGPRIKMRTNTHIFYNYYRIFADSHTRLFSPVTE